MAVAFPWPHPTPDPPIASGSVGTVLGGGVGVHRHEASATSAHNMLKAVMLELGFVVVATMLAGISDTWGNGMLALMLAMLVLRGLFEVDIFAAFAQGTQLHPAL